MSVNAASGHSARAHLPAATVFVNAQPGQQTSRSVAPAAKESAFVPATPATRAAGEQSAGRTLDVKL